MIPIEGLPQGHLNHVGRSNTPLISRCEMQMQDLGDWLTRTNTKDKTPAPLPFVIPFLNTEGLKKVQHGHIRIS
jgi:hypothetical protein